MTDNTTPVKEIKIPVADPNDPYAIPAAMPSSVDHAVRSFNAGDYPEPSRKQDEWRYTPIERINEFFTVFKPSGETQIEVSMIDGSPLAEGVNRAKEANQFGILMVTHYTRILKYIKPDIVHVFADGHFVKTGGPELADELEENGYDQYLPEGADSESALA